MRGVPYKAHHPLSVWSTVTPRTGSAVARYCPLWAWLHSHQPARFCSWELTEQLPRVVTHPGIALASNSLNFGVPTNPKPVSSQKASRYEDASPLRHSDLGEAFWELTGFGVVRTPKLSELEARAIPGWVTTLGSCSVSSQEQNRAGW
ncbi:hypothetical protein L3X38_033525 [Prunus dulcis]|uniref:Uncharacterized protein n=1 Tax=Prunus dulcis TaxID=3755 RepID=A0AAD4VII6_PRUDU|nr:hypothetical protein L3X38_033525 [Prunus dulcis]